MEKPREFWVCAEPQEYDPTGSMPREWQFHMASNRHSWNGDIHAIEKSAYDELVRALEFYADPNNWQSLGGGTCRSILERDWTERDQNNLRFGGKIAREALSKISKSGSEG